MDMHYIIEALHQTGFFPELDGWINFLLFMVLAVGFFIIVLTSKKYRHLLEKLDDYL